MKKTLVEKKYLNVIKSLIINRDFLLDVEKIRNQHSVKIPVDYQKISGPEDLEIWGECIKLSRKYGLPGICSITIQAYIYGEIDLENINVDVISEGLYPDDAETIRYLSGFQIWDTHQLCKCGDKNETDAPSVLLDAVNPVHDYPVALLMNPYTTAAQLKNFIDENFDDLISPLLKKYYKKHSLINNVGHRDPIHIRRDSKIIYLMTKKFLSTKEIVLEINMHFEKKYHIKPSYVRKIKSRWNNSY